MKVFASYLVSLVLLVSLAAPAGAVFASQDLPAEPVAGDVQALEEEDYGDIAPVVTDEPVELDATQKIMAAIPSESEIFPLESKLDVVGEKPEDEDVAVVAVENASETLALTAAPVAKDSPQLVISKIQTGEIVAGGVVGTREFIEIYNSGDSEASLEDVELHFLTKDFDGGDPTRVLKAFGAEDKLAAGEFAVLVHGSVAAEFSHQYIFDISAVGAGSLARSGSVRLVHDTKTLDLIGYGGSKYAEGVAVKSSGSNILQRCQLPSGNVKRTGSNIDDVFEYESWQFGKFPACAPPPEDIKPLPPEDIAKNECKNLRLSEIGSNIDEQFIEIANIGEQTADLLGCWLDSKTRGSKKLSLGEIELDPSDVYLVKISDTELKLAKTKGEVEILDSVGVVIDSYTYDKAKKDTTFINHQGQWLITYYPTPGEANIYQKWQSCEEGRVINESTGNCVKIAALPGKEDCGEGRERNPLTGRCRNIPSPKDLQPCRDNQYRSEETGRCRNIAAARQLVPCREGQYRSESTGRCRSIALTVRALQPCAEDQFRNPSTNRCKKIASQDDVALADCGEGRERNPLTNRCRNILASAPSQADYPVETTSEAATVFVGWWVLGLAILAAAGYVGYEWREEIGRTLRKIFHPGSSGK